ncbi:family 4 glycosyl hydrolase, partial [Vallitalea maricola]
LDIHLEEYPRRCVEQIANWEKQRDELTKDNTLSHKRSTEYGSYIMEAMETNISYTIGGNVMNTGLIPNLPSDCVVEVPCLV